eukprot:TRINITY_DN1771_c1_g1_i4.p1 TRINITY_DN1771_c1_g1~~TRINITY_DN1771_c1_g1_i4.p1  ORF type:complete len:406 (+),score=115.43 TRINITY_DN1771_c1_g1_i4:44-1261(+)
MLSYPLGAHISAPKKRKPKKLTSPSSTYVATVWVYVDDKGRKRDKIMLGIPNGATVEEVGALIWDRALRVNPRREARDYTLMNCHADGEINECLPFLAHNRELKAQLGFPYMVVCCLSPFLIKLEAVTRREAANRSEICVEYTSADSWLYTYAIMLQRLHGICKLLRKDEAEERRRLLMHARGEKYAVLRSLLIKGEGSVRNGIAAEFTSGLDLLISVQLLMQLEITQRKGIDDEFDAALATLGAARSEIEYESLVLKSMQAKNDELLHSTEQIYEAYAQSQRMLYNLSRIHVNVVAAHEVKSSPYAFHQLRVKLHAPAYELPPKRKSRATIHADSLVERPAAGTALDLRRKRHALCLPDVILNDHYTSSWPTLPNKIAPPRARLENLEPHLRPGGQRSIDFRQW